MKKLIPILLLSLALFKSQHVFAQCEPVLSYNTNWADLPACWSFPNGNAGIGFNGFGGQSGGAFIRSIELINLQGTYSITTRTITNVNSGFTLQLVQNDVVVQSIGVAVSPGNFKTQTFQFNVAGPGYIQIAQLTTNAPFIALGNMSFTGVCPAGAAVNAKVKDITLSLNASGTASITPQDLDDGSGDICGNSVTLSIDKSSFTCDDLGSNSISFTATRGDGVSDNIIATVTVEPALALSSSNIFLDESGNANYTIEELLASSSTSCNEISYAIDRLDFSCADMVSPQELLVTASYGGLTTSKSLFVNVKDAIAPTAIAQGLTIQLDPNTGNASITSDMVDNGSSDNCNINLSLSKTQFGCADLGQNEVTLTVTDNNSNTTTATAIITVISTMTEETVTAANTQFCADGTTGTTITVGGSLAGYSYSLRNSANNSVVDGPIAGTGSPLDFSTGNLTQTTTFNVFAETSVNANSALDFDGANDRVIVPIDAGFNYQNGYTLEAWINGPLTSASKHYPIFHVGTASTSDIEVYLQNSSNRMIVVHNRRASGSPTYNEYPTPPANVWYHLAVTYDGSNIRIYYDGTEKLPITGANAGALTKTTGAELNIGYVQNASGWGTALRNFTGKMDEVRIWNTAKTSADILAKKDLCLTGSESGLVSYYNFDDGTGTVATDQAGTSDGILTNMDGNTDWVAGATISCLASCDFQLSTEIKIGDNIAPTAAAQNIILSLDINGQVVLDAASLNNGSTDDCSSENELTFSTDQDIFTCSDLGENQVTFMVMDASGNHASANVVVTITDQLAPTAIAQNITVSLDALGAVNITASEINNGSSDNCTASENMVMSIDKTDFTCDHLGENTVVLTVTDATGNTSSVNSIVNVIDNVSPIAIAKDFTLSLDVSGQAQLIADNLNNGSSDNCTTPNDLVLGISKTDFSCADLGSNTVTLTVTDASGNATTGTATVTVVDAIAPIAISQDISIRLDVNNQASITGSEIDNGSSDNCGGLTFSLDKSTFDETNLGPNQVVLTVDDGNGNIATANATVTVLEYKTAQSISFILLPDLIYGAGVQTLSATANSNLSVNFAVIDGPATVDGNTMTITGAGVVTIEATQAGDDTFLGADAVQQSFTVSKANLNVTADNQSIAYGDQIPSLTMSYSGFVNGDEANALSELPSIVTSLGKQEGNTSVGSYDIVLSGGSSDNYELVLTNGTLTINPITLTVAADALTMVFGEEVPTLTFTYQGFIGNETSANISTEPTIGTSATSSSDVGEYAITLSGGSATNYNFTLINSTITITKATATIEISNLEQTADGTTKNVIVTTTPGALNVTVTYNRIQTAPITAGEYAIVVTVDETNWMGTAEATLNILPAPLGISLQHQKSIEIYPTPAINNLSIKLSETIDAKAVIYDIDGHEVVHFAWFGNEQNLDVTELSSGLYLIQIFNSYSEMIHRQKLLIKK